MDASTARDPRIVDAQRLLREPAGGRFVVDGEDLLAQALAAGVVVERVFEGGHGWAERVDAEHVVAAPDALRALGALGQAPAVAAVCRVPEPPPGPLPAGALVLAGVRDAGNVGSILRTAAALRLPRVELVDGCTDPWSRKALRAALGASFTPGLVAATGRTLAEVAAERPLAAAVPRGGVEPAALAGEVAVVLGSERDGLTAAQVALCDVAVSIPAPGFESLNVAAAAAILAWEAARRRGRGGGDG